jgi:hypothetical protein
MNYLLSPDSCKGSNINSHVDFTRNLFREHYGRLAVLKSPKQPILVDAYSAKSDL